MSFLLEELLNATEAAHEIAGLVRQEDGLRLVAAGHLLQHLNIVLCQEVVGRICALTYRRRDLLDGSGLSLGLADTGCSLTLGAEDGLLLVGLSAVDGSRLLTLRLENLSLLLTLRGEDGGTLVTLGLHLLLHSLQDALRRDDVLKLDAVDLDTPFVGSIVEDTTELGVDNITRGEGLVELHLTDDITQRRLCELLDGVGEVVNLINRLERVYYWK